MKITLSKTLKNLILLLSILIIGLISLISLHIFFLNLVDELDKKIQNMENKIKIGQYIIDDLYKIRSDFYELATTTTNFKERKQIEKKIKNHTSEIKKSLRILERGGTLKKVIRLNIVGHLDTIKTISYENMENKLPLESIELLPKLKEFENMTKQSLKLFKLNDNLTAYNKSFRRFYKKTPAFFNRITENANRLLYETSNEVDKLKQQINAKKARYTQLELLIIIAILFIVISLSILIMLQTDRNSKRLKRKKESIRGILDAQQNIVVVSNGEYMIDSNEALVNFFIEYKSFEEFSKEHLCICDFFEDINDDEYIVDKDYDRLRWFEYVIAHPEKNHKVAMHSGIEIHQFTLGVTKKFIDSENFILIITLNNISKLIKTEKKLSELNNNLENIVDEKTRELQKLNETLEERVQVELTKNREKDKTLIHQGRLAAMGEMISNIAHQWRQPLSAISSTSSSAKLQMQLGLISNDDIVKSFDEIDNYVNFLNSTIEDFRNFFKKEKKIINFDIVKEVNNSISMINASYKSNNIELKLNFSKEEFITEGSPSEFSHVILNILTNAKDVLKDRDSKSKLVKIDIYEHDNNNIIKICDNAQGIDKSIMHKIFDPYFTTKHKSQGTGIGLYMSKQIIEKNMHGSLNAYNITFTENHKEHFGACFEIELPKI